MLSSTMLPSKISGTKKRLSSDRWIRIASGVAWVGVFILFGYLMRAVSVPSSYGTVDFELPVISVVPLDPTSHHFRETPKDEIRRTTPVIVLTEQAFYFGDVAAFSTNFSDKQQKFMIPHENQTPQTGKLVDAMKEWLKRRYDKQNIAVSSFAVFVPKGLIPMNIVILAVEQLKREKAFERIVFGTELY